MAKKDTYHDLVKDALVAEGWTVTDDPLRVKAGKKRKVEIDLAAERLIGAQRGDEKIAVEIKSFLDDSPLTDLYAAVGKFDLYHYALEKTSSDRTLFLAMPKDSFEDIFSEPFYLEYAFRHQLNLIIFHPLEKNIVAWKSFQNTNQSSGI